MSAENPQNQNPTDPIEDPNKLNVPDAPTETTPDEQAEAAAQIRANLDASAGKAEADTQSAESEQRSFAGRVRDRIAEFAKSPEAALAAANTIKHVGMAALRGANILVPAKDMEGTSHRSRANRGKLLFNPNGLTDALANPKRALLGAAEQIGKDAPHLAASAAYDTLRGKKTNANIVGHVDLAAPAEKGEPEHITPNPDAVPMPSRNNYDEFMHGPNASATEQVPDTIPENVPQVRPAGGPENGHLN